MKIVARYQSKNGELWETPKEALLADLKEKFETWYANNTIHEYNNYPVESETIFEWCMTNGIIIPGVIEVDSLEPKEAVFNPSLNEWPPI